MWRFSPASTHYICCRYESVLELSKPPTLWCLCIHAVANSRSHCVVVILQSVSISYRVASKSVALLKLHITSITVYRKKCVKNTLSIYTWMFDVVELCSQAFCLPKWRGEPWGHGYKSDSRVGCGEQDYLLSYCCSVSAPRVWERTLQEGPCIQALTWRWGLF